MDNITRNWKTTLLGVIAAIVGVAQANKVGFVNAFTDPLTQVSIVSAVGLALAKDADKVGTTPGTKGAADGAGPGAA